jgi:chromate transport protein ChrA
MNQPLRHPSLALLFISFLRLGLTSFGWPSMIAYIHRMAVDQKSWLETMKHFVQAWRSSRLYLGHLPCRWQLMWV